MREGGGGGMAKAEAIVPHRRGGDQSKPPQAVFMLFCVNKPSCKQNHCTRPVTVLVLFVELAFVH